VKELRFRKITGCLFSGSYARTGSSPNNATFHPVVVDIPLRPKLQLYIFLIICVVKGDIVDWLTNLPHCPYFFRPDYLIDRTEELPDLSGEDGIA
jgi:hypothetical protein